MRYLLRQTNSLGDAVNLLPACLHLAQQGHEVFFESRQKYSGIFDAVTYVRWAAPGSVRPDTVLDCTIHDVREGDHVQDIVYDRYPEIRAAKRRLPVFDAAPAAEGYGLPPDYVLFVPFAYSVPVPGVKWMLAVIQKHMGGLGGVFGLAEHPDAAAGVPFVTARRLADLPSLIRGAREFFTVNTGPTVIASGVRPRYHHVHTDYMDGKCNYHAPNQIVLRVE
jgi:hypothetical protein